jgi:bifunctional non-homologous end joining protein LigD
MASASADCDTLHAARSAAAADQPVRQVKGATFYHMGPLPEIPAAVRQLRLEKRKRGTGTRLWGEDLAGLLGLVETGVVEIHPWGAKIDES